MFWVSALRRVRLTSHCLEHVPVQSPARSTAACRQGVTIDIDTKGNATPERAALKQPAVHGLEPQLLTTMTPAQRGILSTVFRLGEATFGPPQARPVSALERAGFVSVHRWLQGSDRTMTTVRPSQQFAKP